jgi:death-on-curing protein
MKINLTSEDIVDIHNDIINVYGGDHGIVSLSSLEFILEHAKVNPYGEDFFTILAKILRAITIDHPFADGNKRTGIVIIETILEDNDLIFSATEKEKEEFILSVAKVELELENIVEFLISKTDEYCE